VQDHRHDQIVAHHVADGDRAHDHHAGGGGEPADKGEDGERRDGVIGGLNFPGDQDPDYWDFLYFSLVIGMTSQVSDVAITSRSIRRIAAMHGVLSFFFNVTVLALTVNMVSNVI